MTLTSPMRENPRQTLHLHLSGAGLCWLLPFCRAELRQALAVMLQAADAGEAELDLVLVRDGDMAAYNARYMACHGPTNVLSFPLDEQPGTGEDAPLALGALVLSVDTLRREALLYGQDTREHCLRLLAHGLGHLAGYDHGPEMDALCSTMLEAAERWLNAQ